MYVFTIQNIIYHIARAINGSYRQLCMDSHLEYTFVVHTDICSICAYQKDIQVMYINKKSTPHLNSNLSKHASQPTYG